MSTDTGTASVVEFTMPSLGADMEHGRITEWLVAPGDRVERGQIVVVVETDKSDIEVEVFEPCTIVELLVTEGASVAVGTPIARIETAAPAARIQRPTAPVAGAASAAPPPQATPAASPARTHITSPVIRRLADQLHVNASAVPGSGPGGRVHRDDVERIGRPSARPRITPRARRLLAEHGRPVPDAIDRAVLTGEHVLATIAAGEPSARPAVRADATRADRQETMRRHIADLMTRSWQEIPHYHVSSRLDLSTLTGGLAEHNAGRTLADRVVPGAALLWAAARAATAVPACNGWWRGDRFEPATSVTLGVVLSLRTGGIVVPSILRADELTVDELMARLGELVQRARLGRLRASDMAEASITVTSLGDRGAETVSGVIHPPQVALVGFGAVRDDVWAVDGEIVSRPTVTATVTGDHRAVDGLTGSRFLAQLQVALDRPLLED